MKIGEIVDNFKVPPHPSNIILEGNLVRLEPLKADKHSVHLFESNAIDKEVARYALEVGCGVGEGSFPHLGDQPGKSFLHQVGCIVDISGLALEVAQQARCLRAVCLRENGRVHFSIRQRNDDPRALAHALGLVGAIALVWDGGGGGTGHETPGHAADSINAPKIGGEGARCVWNDAGASVPTVRRAGRTY